eukprot:scaffold264848_cov17-Prasinocladus_malaysianus.AAC.2
MMISLSPDYGFMCDNSQLAQCIFMLNAVRVDALSAGFGHMCRRCMHNYACLPTARPSHQVPANASAVRWNEHGIH